MKRFFYFLCLTSLLFAAAPSLAAENKGGEKPKLLSIHDDWKLYSFAENGKKVCFISSQPKKQEGNFKKRGEVFIFITRGEDEKSKDVVSVSNGYTFKDNSLVTVKINGRIFKLFTSGEMAWAKDSTTDSSITNDIQKSRELLVKGTSKSGTETTDTYSLKGSGDAYKAMQKECPEVVAKPL